jgi:hypothetical protein
MVARVSTPSGGNQVREFGSRWYSSRIKPGFSSPGILRCQSPIRNHCDRVALDKSMPLLLRGIAEDSQAFYQPAKPQSQSGVNYDAATI